MVGEIRSNRRDTCQAKGETRAPRALIVLVRVERVCAKTRTRRSRNKATNMMRMSFTENRLNNGSNET